MKKILITASVCALFFTGCTVKKIVKSNAPSYEQQQNSFQKAYKDM